MIHNIMICSWQNDIDRLMRKLEEPISSIKTETQIEETQIEEENIGSIYRSQTETTYHNRFRQLHQLHKQIEIQHHQ